jgi:DNA adenine methylase
MPTTDSPLRYPGGKTQLAPFVSELLRANDLTRCAYAEPFAGGAGVAWRLLFAGHVSEIWLNDIDVGIYSFWKTVLDQPDALCEHILAIPIDMSQWREQRRVLQSSTSPLKLAFATLFLNRTNRSGIIAGGVIGGKTQQGNYKLDCRFNRTELVKKIQRISSYRDVVHISRLDGKHCLSEWAKSLPKRALLNIDPPYFCKGQELYTNFYQPKDHAALAEVIRSVKVPWMLTYDKAPEIELLYSGLPVFRKDLTYYAQVKRKASELLVLSRDLQVPESLSRQAALAA